MIGRVIKGNYRIMDQVGQDSLSTVYLAKDIARNRVVTLKVVNPERAAETQFAQRFERDASRLKRLNSTQAVKVYDYGKDEGLYFIVLEHVQGQSLADVLADGGPLETGRALDIAGQVATCLVDAHTKGVVHRDLRPDNVIAITDRVVRVVGFSVAWGAETARLMALGELGSPHYLSPEQASRRTVDARSDIYSLGAILFEMLSGKVPYDAGSAAEIVLAHLYEPVPALHELDTSIPREVGALVSKCMAKEPGDRYQSAAELVEAIDAILRALAASGGDIGLDIDMVGQTLGEYQIVGQLGEGGMSTVYKAYQSTLDRYVAIKVLPPYLARGPEFAVRFEREAKAVARLAHPNVLPIYGFGREAGLSYIVMRCVEEGTLKEMLGEPIDLETTAEIVGQIAQAMDYAHRRGIVHRDIKPSNVLMAEGKWALLADFGLARMVESSTRLTKSGTLGTPAYMSPEQWEGEKADARSDVYSLGVVLYEMATGKVPFEAETPMAVGLKHVSEPLPSPRSLNPDLPEAVEWVIQKALTKSPKDRYQTAGELAKALKDAVAQAPVGAWLPGIEPMPAEAVPPVAVVTPIPASAEAARSGAPPVGERGLPSWTWKLIGAVALAALLVIGGGLIITRVLFPPQTREPWLTATLASTPSATPAIAPPTDTPLPPTPTPAQPAGAATSTPLSSPPTATLTATSTPLPPPPTATPTATSTSPPPTATPTATSTSPPPTATATPAARWFPAPRLTAPPNEASFAGWNAEVILQWESVGSLAESEYYVVRIPYDSAGGVAEFWRKETSFAVPSNFSLAEVGFPDRHYNWSVQVMRCTASCAQALDDNVRKDGAAAGTASAERTFYWHPDVGGPPSGKPTPTLAPP